MDEDPDSRVTERTLSSTLQAEATAPPANGAPSFLTFRQLGADTLLYGLGGAVAKLVGLLLVLVYTRVFTPSQYGTVELLNVMAMMLSMIIVLGLDTAQTVYVSQRSPDDQARRDVVSATLHWKAIWGVVAISLLLFAAPVINRMMFRNTLLIGDFAWAFAGAYFTCFITQMTDLARVLRKRTAYLAVSLAQAVVTAALVLSMILWLDRGIRGYLQGVCIAAAAVSLFALWSFRSFIVAAPRSNELYKGLLRFGLPLVPGGLAMYVLLSSGHWIIASRFGREEVGVYAVAVKFASVVTLMMSVLQTAWLPYGLESLGSAAGRAFFTQILLVYSACAALSVAVLGFAGPSLVGVLVPAEYARAGWLMGLALVAPLYFGFYYLFSIQGVLRAGKTLWLTIIPTFCAVLNVVLSMTLARWLRVEGIVLGSAVSAVALALITFHASQKYAPIPLSPRIVEILALITLGSAVVFALPVTPGITRYGVVLINILTAAACIAAARNRPLGDRDVSRT